MYQLLLENIAAKFRNENDLSDITWAFCESNEDFKNDFVSFFFPHLRDQKISVLEREKTKNRSRVDLYFTDQKNEIYLIEVKIYDSNQHFEQYCEEYEIESHNLGYILNYSFSKTDFKTKTWAQLYDYLKYRKEALLDLESKDLYESYLAYIQNVCNISPIYKKINLKTMYDLYTFSELLKRQLTYQDDDFSIEIYRRKLNDIRSGYDVKLTKNNLKDIWFWIGVYYNSENPIICCEIWNNEQWAKSFVDIIEENMENFDYKYAEKPYFENDCYYFEVSEFFKKSFFESNNLKDQEILLKNYILEIVSFYK